MKHDILCSNVVLVITLWFLSMIALPAEPYRAFKSKSGQVMKARILNVDGDQIKIERNDGMQFTVDKNIFSFEDQKMVDAWVDKYENGMS